MYRVLDSVVHQINATSDIRGSGSAISVEDDFHRRVKTVIPAEVPYVLVKIAVVVRECRWKLIEDAFNCAVDVFHGRFWKFCFYRFSRLCCFLCFEWGGHLLN